MHWSDKIADKIIKRNPDKEEYVCAAGISPSGSIHIGNFRDIATSLFVVKALERKGKKARLLFSWDEYDRIRKIPVNVAKANSEMEQYIGVSYVDAPNPFGTKETSYAAYFEKEFQASIDRFGIKLDYRYQGEMNKSGKYQAYIIESLQKRKEIFDILDSFRTQDAKEGEREAYYPVSIYCPQCMRDTTKILSLSDDCTTAEYTCTCGHKGIFDFTKDHHCKLAWKVDWPMRWKYEQVDFEPGGKDHASPGGSYDTSKVIAKKIFHYDAPIFQGYEFIGIKGSTGKMSGSSGLNLTPDTLLHIYQPEVILWLYARCDPNKAFDFCFDDGILRQYFEFDRQYNNLMEGKADERTKEIMANCLIPGKQIHTVPMSHLVQLGSVVDFQVDMLETVFEKIGTPYKEFEFRDRLNLAKYWLENCSPENVNKLRNARNWEYYNGLDEQAKASIAMLHRYLSTAEYTLNELNTELYEIPKRIYGYDCENLKAIQGKFFKDTYMLLLNKEKGPRLYLFLYAINKEDFLRLLDFSTAMTQEEAAEIEREKNPQPDDSQQPEEAAVYGEPDEVLPVQDEIELDDFQKCDFRVCKVLKCTEIRKSHSCYKLVLFDGLKERVIVSSLKKYYKPEELVGKKIIVIANLKPARLTGVTSEGMLIAATNQACGCKVIFVDDSVPEGTRIG